MTKARLPYKNTISGLTETMTAAEADQRNYMNAQVKNLSRWELDTSLVPHQAIEVETGRVVDTQLMTASEAAAYNAVAAEYGGRNRWEVK